MINNSFLLEKYDGKRKPNWANKKRQSIFLFNKLYTNNTSVICLLRVSESYIRTPR